MDSVLAGGYPERDGRTEQDRDRPILGVMAISYVCVQYSLPPLETVKEEGKNRHLTYVAISLQKNHRKKIAIHFWVMQFHHENGNFLGILCLCPIQSPST